MLLQQPDQLLPDQDFRAVDKRLHDGLVAVQIDQRKARSRHVYIDITHTHVADIQSFLLGTGTDCWSGDGFIAVMMMSAAEVSGRLHGVALTVKKTLS
jgi:hypothetical protein